MNHWGEPATFAPKYGTRDPMSRSMPVFRLAFGLLAACWVAFPAGAQNPSPFPVRVSTNGRHLVDASGKPFLLHGDTAWSLTWREGMESQGEREMVCMKRLFEARDWCELIPDQDHSVVTAGYGTFGTPGKDDLKTGGDYVTAARVRATAS